MPKVTVLCSVSGLAEQVACVWPDGALKSKPTSEALYPRAPSPAEDTPVPGSRGSSFIAGASLFTLPQPRLERKLQRQRELEKEADVPASQPAVAPLGKGNRLALDIKSVFSLR